MKEIIAEYIDMHDRPTTYSTGTHEQGGCGYDERDTTFVRVYSPTAALLIRRDRLITLQVID